MKKRLIYCITSLAILHSVYANGQPAGWEVDPADFANSMTFTWQISLPEGESIDPEDYLAAFVEGECRGVVSAIELNDSGNFYFLLLVHSNATVGDQISFSFYDASAQEVFDYPDLISFESEKIAGSFSQPNLFTIEPPVVLNVGEEITSELRVFPNPTTDQLKLNVANFGLSDITVVDLKGTIVLSNDTEMINDDFSLSVTSLNPGIYYIVIRSSSKIVKGKFIKL